ncbi:hypothetical protein JZ751_014743 [Albula glossodonta]|uniref:Uncharacterized protein n=1 Tax=Albula glossodonta TaxID=121402 RepID=A0A8T2MWZ1_9TELE|nr:hypothetical protein JZ751_014743 [Albula glossodonta]
MLGLHQIRECKKPPLAPKPKIRSHLTFRLPSTLMSRPRASTRGPKPPVAPKPKVLHDPGETCCMDDQVSLNSCSNGDLQLSEEELDQENEPGGGLASVMPATDENGCSDEDSEEEERVPEAEEEETVIPPTEIEGTDSADTPEISDTECSADSAYPPEVTDAECTGDEKPEIPDAAEVLEDTGVFPDCDAASGHNGTSHHLESENSQEDLRQEEYDTNPAGEQDVNPVEELHNMDMGRTSELTNRLVFADASDVFVDDMDYEGHIVPYLEETDTDRDNISDEHVYEEAGLDSEGENFLAMDRKSIVTRSRSLSGKVPGYVPETVPEEPGIEYQMHDYYTVALDKSGHPLSDSEQLEINRMVPSSVARRFILYPRSYSVEGREMPMSIFRENESCLGEEGRMKRTDDNLSLPCVIGSSGSFSQRSHLPSSGMSTPTSVVDIPPPFELASITKKPITKSSPSLLIESDTFSEKQKKKKSSFKRFLTLKFRRKTENKVHVDVNVSSSRSSSESSHHGPLRVLELDRRSTGSSPQLKVRSGKPQWLSDSPSTFLFYKDGKRKGGPNTFSNRCVSRVESFEDRSRPPFIPLPLTKPRSISFPNADTSDYENIPAMSSDYENIQIPPRRPARAATFVEFFDDPNRALSSANENDGYVDMSSFTGFENKPQTTDQETERKKCSSMPGK